MCLGYDPVFKVTHDRRRGPGPKKLSDGSVDSVDIKDEQLPVSTATTTAAAAPSPTVVVKTEYGVSMDSTALTSKTANTETTHTSSLSNGTEHTSPICANASYEDPRNKMNISSLLDAAAQIDEEGTKELVPAPEALEASNAPVSLKRGFQDEGDKLVAEKRQRVRQNSKAAMEDQSCETWDQVERNFTKYIAGFLDKLFATDRFSRMPIVGKARASGLPLDGVGTVAILGNTAPGSAPLSASTVTSLTHQRNNSQSSDNGDDIGGATGGSAGLNNTVLVGQNIALLEAVRQTLEILCPSFYLNNLSIDEASVGKLEELRVSNDFRLLRAVVQMIQSTRETEILSVWERDHDVFLRIQALHRFISGSVECGVAERARQEHHQLTYEQQQQQQHGSYPHHLAHHPHHQQPNQNPYHHPQRRHYTQDEIAKAHDRHQQVVEYAQRVFELGLDKASSEDLWTVLVYISRVSKPPAGVGPAGGSINVPEPCTASSLQDQEALLSSDQEEAFFEFCMRRVKEESSEQSFSENKQEDDDDVWFAMLMGAHYYLLTRRPVHPPSQQLATVSASRESSIRLRLLESCSTAAGANNVVIRRLVNMALS